MPGLILSGLARLPGRQFPPENVRRDIGLLFKGVEQALDHTAMRVCGGSWKSAAVELRASARTDADPIDFSNFGEDGGFRCVRDNP